jgi:hypothetical protein
MWVLIGMAGLSAIMMIVMMIRIMMLVVEFLQVYLLKRSTNRNALVGTKLSEAI